MEYRGDFREGVFVNAGIRLPSLRQIIIWLVIITVVSFAIGGIITKIDGEHYRTTNGDKITPVNISPNGVENAEVSLEMETGSINLSEGTDEYLLSGDISGKNTQKGPTQTFETRNGTGYLTIKQESTVALDPISKEDTWNLALCRNIPISLSIISGTGSVSYQSGSLNLTNLAIHLGTGDLLVDLSSWKGRHLPVVINAGLGSVTIILPQDASIAASLESGLGSRTISGFEGGEGSYFHTGSDHNVSAISLSIKQGIGDLTMKVAP